MGIFTRRRRSRHDPVEPRLRPPPANRRRSSSGTASPDPRPLARRAVALGPLLARRLLTGRAWLAALAALGVAFGAGFLLVRHATTADYFAVSSIDLRGSKQTTPAELLAAAEITLPVNFFALDEERIVTALKRHPWIASARVQRRLPRQVVVTVVERRAAATLFVEVPYLVDEAGVVFKRWVPGDPTPLPTLTGVTREDFSPGGKTDAALADALALIATWRSGPMAAIAQPGEIHLEPDGGLSVSLAGKKTYVRLGNGPYRPKLERLAGLWRRLERDHEIPEVIYLDNRIRPDRITVDVRREPGDAPGTAPAPSGGKVGTKI